MRLKSVTVNHIIGCTFHLLTKRRAFQYRSPGVATTTMTADKHLSERSSIVVFVSIRNSPEMQYK